MTIPFGLDLGSLKYYDFPEVVEKCSRRRKYMGGSEMRGWRGPGLDGEKASKL